MRELRGRSAILTGASRGIGPHIARALVREGINVALVARSVAELQTLATEIGGAGVRVVPIATDLGSAALREALVARAEAELGLIDILINNAGTHTPVRSTLGRLHTSMKSCTSTSWRQST